MEENRTLLKNPLVLIVAGVVVGLILGIIFGWFVWPVTWKDADPQSLSQGWQQDFLKMAVSDYSRTRDLNAAQERYKALGKGGEALLSGLMADPSTDQVALMDFQTAVTGAAAVMPTPVLNTPLPGTELTPVAPLTETQTPGELPKPPATTQTGGSWLSTALLCLLGIVLIALVGLFIFSRTKSGSIQIATLAQAAKEFVRVILFPNRYKETGASSAAQEAAEARRNVVMTDYASTGVEAPVAQFMASFKLGDDLFDDSFSIDSPSGEFLGECGVGISETIGSGDPKKVTAFEVWLFDKNDIQTVTKVLMSRHAFGDGSLRSRLEAKGETVEAAPGAEFELQTQTLTMVARVVDMDYGTDPSVPGGSHFDRMLLELAIWQKPA